MGNHCNRKSTHDSDQDFGLKAFFTTLTSTDEAISFTRRMKMKYSLSVPRIVTIALVLMLLLAACTAAKPAAESKEPIQLVLWHQESPPQRVESFQKIIDQFNKEHETIQVRQEPQSWAEIYAKLYASIEAGNPPDVAFSIPDMSMAMKLTGALQPVEDIVNEIESKYDYIDSQVVPYKYEGHVWSVPMWGMTHLLCYNQGAFDEAGISYPFKNWDEELAAAQKLTADGKFGVAFPASQLMMTDQNIYNYMVTNKCEIFDKDGNVTIDSPSCVESFTYYNELLQYAPPDVVSWNWGDNEMSFLSETSYMIQLFPSFGAWMNAEKEGKGPFSCMRVPYPEGGQYGSASYSNGAMVFTKDPARQAAVKEFLLYLHQPEINGAWLSDWEPGVYLPITKASMDSKAFWSHPAIDYFKDEVKLQADATADGKLFGFEYEPQEVIGRVAGENLLGQIAGKMKTGEMTPEEAAAWAAETIRQWQEELKND
jgi:multiple sugar transport system substrate-binding protein